MNLISDEAGEFNFFEKIRLDDGSPENPLKILIRSGADLHTLDLKYNNSHSGTFHELEYDDGEVESDNRGSFEIFATTNN